MTVLRTIGTAALYAVALAGCPKQELKLADRYEHCGDLDSTPPYSCDDVHEKIKQYVKEADTACEEKQKQWKSDSDAVKDIIRTELETAQCYHSFIRGRRNSVTQRPKKLTTYDSFNSLQDPWIDTANAQTDCGGAITDANVKKHYGSLVTESVGTKTGLKIKCEKNDGGVITCNYLFPDQGGRTKTPAYLQTTDSVGLFEGDFRDDSSENAENLCAVFRNAILDYSQELGPKSSARKEGNLTTRAYTFGEKRDPITVYCYEIDHQPFCEAKQKYGLYTNTSSCPSLTGFVSDGDWIPHATVLRTFQPQELNALRKEIQEDKNRKTEPERQPLTAPFFAVDSSSLEYRTLSLYTGFDSTVLQLFDPFSPENLDFDSQLKIDGAEKRLETTVVVTAYTPQQRDDLRTLANIIATGLFSNNDDPQFKITYVSDTISFGDIPTSLEFLVTTELPKDAKDAMKRFAQEGTSTARQYKEICSPKFIEQNPALLAFQSGSGTYFECVVDESASPTPKTVSGIASVEDNVWTHSPFTITNIKNGKLATIAPEIKGVTYTLSHVVCEDQYSWTQFRRTDGYDDPDEHKNIINVFSDAEHGKDFKDSDIRKEANKFCHQ